MTKKVIKRRAVFAEIHQDTRGDRQHIFSLKYRKIDGSVSYKTQLSKTTKTLPGESKFRGNLNQNHELLLCNNEELDPKRKYFRIKVDLMVEYNGMIIDHTV